MEAQICLSRRSSQASTHNTYTDQRFAPSQCQKTLNIIRRNSIPTYEALSQESVHWSNLPISVMIRSLLTISTLNTSRLLHQIQLLSFTILLVWSPNTIVSPILCIQCPVMSILLTPYASRWIMSFLLKSMQTTLFTSNRNFLSTCPNTYAHSIPAL